MPIYGSNAVPMLEDLQEAKELERKAAVALAYALKNGIKDTQTLTELTKRLEETTNVAADIYSRLQQVRLDT